MGAVTESSRSSIPSTADVQIDSARYRPWRGTIAVPLILTSSVLMVVPSGRH